MTVIEKEYMDAVIQMNRRQRDNEPDWEQRRYEIAKEVIATQSLRLISFAQKRLDNLILSLSKVRMTKTAAKGMAADYFGGNETEFGQAAKFAVEIADALIAELKETAAKN